MGRILTSVQMWESIHGAGLATPDVCRRWAKMVADDAGKEALGDAAQLAAALVRLELLTPYQANVILRHLPYPLVLDRVIVRRSLEGELGAWWYEGTDSETERRLWIVALGSEALSDGAVIGWPPSMQWAERHCGVQAPGLEEWSKVGATWNFMYATVEPFPVGPLAQQLGDGPMRVETSNQLVREIALALQAMHEGGLIHGRVNLHALVGDSTHGYVLRRDPFFPPRSPYQGPTPTVLPDGDNPLAVAAPELALPGATPSIRSDLYALGCVWYRCLTGEWPFQPELQAPPQKWALLHSQVPVKAPPSLSEIAGKCLMYLLAKDPRSRFASANAFLAALDSAPAERSDRTSSTEKRVDLPGERQEPIPQATVPSKSVTKDQVRESLVMEATQEYVLPQSKDPPPEKLAAEMRDKKSKLARRYHTRPFGATVPAPVPEIEIPLPQASPVPTVSPDAILGKNAMETVVPSMADSAKPDAVTVPGEDRSKKGFEQKDAPKSRGKKKKSKKGKTSSKVGDKGNRKPKRPVWVLPVLMIGSMVLLGGLAFLLRGQSQGVVTITNTPNRPTSADKQPSENSPVHPPASTLPAIDPLTEYFELKPDDGKIPWAPPSVGSPFSLDLLPMGSESLVFLSKRAWLGQGVAESLSAWWNVLHANDTALLPEAAWVRAEDVSYVTVAWYPGKIPSTSQRVVRFSFQDAKKVSEWMQGMEGWTARTTKSTSDGFRGTLWQRDAEENGIAMVVDDFASSPDALTKRITLGPPELLEGMVETKGVAGPLRRQMDVLLQATDRRADITVLAAPSFLYGDGKGLLGSEGLRLLDTMKSVVDDKVQALLLRSHFEPEWYFEWRTLGNDLQAATRNATELRTNLEKLPDVLEAAFVSQPADPYWRAIANRLPQMLRSFARFARSGAEDGQVVFNAYLPGEALPNLVVGAWMATQRDLAVASGTKTPATTATVVKTGEQWLESKISLRIEQDSLENVLQAIATEVKESSGSTLEPLPMAINGTAFQKDGITRNQQIRKFELSDVPLRQALTDLSRRANPVTTVQAPNEKDQKVVWVLVDQASAPSKKKIELTTRAWTDANQANLPSEFVIPKDP